MVDLYWEVEKWLGVGLSGIGYVALQLYIHSLYPHVWCCGNDINPLPSWRCSSDVKNIDTYIEITTETDMHMFLELANAGNVLPAISWPHFWFVAQRDKIFKQTLLELSRIIYTDTLPWSHGN